MSKKEDLTKTITIFGSFNTSNEMKYTIVNMNFVPDLCIVRHVSKVDNDHLNSELLILKSTLFDNLGILSFSNSATYDNSVQIMQTLKRNVNGEHSFYLVKMNGAAPTSLDIDIALTIEFVKYQ